MEILVSGKTHTRNRNFIENEKRIQTIVVNSYALYLFLENRLSSACLCIDMHLNSDFGRFDKSLHILCKIIPLFLFHINGCTNHEPQPHTNSDRKTKQKKKK